MANPEWGTKRVCPKCASKFYDMKKNPASCPICGLEFDPEAPVKKRGKKKTVKMGTDDAKTKVMAAANLSNEKARAKSAEDEDAIDLPDFEDLGIIEDIDDLGDMDDVEGLKAKKPVAADESDDDDAFIEDDDIVLDDLDDDDDEDDDK